MLIAEEFYKVLVCNVLYPTKSQIAYYHKTKFSGELVLCIRAFNISGYSSPVGMQNATANWEQVQIENQGGQIESHTMYVLLQNIRVV